MTVLSLSGGSGINPAFAFAGWLGGAACGASAADPTEPSGGTGPGVPTRLCQYASVKKSKNPTTITGTR
jgi:hypothetical protein